MDREKKEQIKLGLGSGSGLGLGSGSGLGLRLRFRAKLLDLTDLKDLLDLEGGLENLGYNDSRKTIAALSNVRIMLKFLFSLEFKRIRIDNVTALTFYANWYH